MTTNDLLRRVLAILPNARISEDNDGQVVINTGLHSVAGTVDLFGAPEEGGIDELFIVSRLSRGGIADELNDTLDRDEFGGNDTRLTSEICERYTEKYGSTLADCMGDDSRQAEAFGEMNWEFLKDTWGIEV